MGLNIGGNIKSIYCGGNIKEAYVGSHKVFSSGGGGNVVHIGEHDYEFVQIGNQLWTKKSLFEDLPNSVWYSDNPSYGDLGFGKLYPPSAVSSGNETMSSYLSEILPSGWRLPTKADWDTLFNLIGDKHGRALKSVDYWEYSSSCYGLDSFGFCVYPSGYRGWNYNWYNINQRAHFWSSTTNSYDQLIIKKFLYNFPHTIEESNQNYENMACSVRLVKDI